MPSDDNANDQYGKVAADHATVNAPAEPGSKRVVIGVGVMIPMAPRIASDIVYTRASHGIRSNTGSTSCSGRQQRGRGSTILPAIFASTDSRRQNTLWTQDLSGTQKSIMIRHEEGVVEFIHILYEATSRIE